MILTSPSMVTIGGVVAAEERIAGTAAGAETCVGAAGAGRWGAGGGDIGLLAGSGATGAGAEAATGLG